MTQNPYSPLLTKSIQLFCIKPYDSRGMLYLDNIHWMILKRVPLALKDFSSSEKNLKFHGLPSACLDLWLLTAAYTLFWFSGCPT